jgi:hypothetical protein
MTHRYTLLHSVQTRLSRTKPLEKGLGWTEVKPQEEVVDSLISVRRALYNLVVTRARKWKKHQAYLSHLYSLPKVIAFVDNPGVCRRLFPLS